MAVPHNRTRQPPPKKQPKPTIVTNGARPRPPVHKIRLPHLPESTQLMGMMALLISNGILLILSGMTVTTTVISLILFVPVIIITSPIWVPIAIFLFFMVAGVLSICGVGLAVAVVQVLIKDFILFK